MRKPNHKFANRQRKLQAKSRKQIERDNDTFYDTDLLFAGIDLALKNPETNQIVVEVKNNGHEIILRGPNPKSQVCVKIICARSTQLESVKERYKHCIIDSMVEVTSRLERATGYGLDSFKRINFSSREEWIREWSTAKTNFILSDEQFDFYCTKEIWANDDYWAILDKKCEAGIHTTFLGYPLWHLMIRQRGEKAFRDWRVLQGIKNKIVGEEFEAIELYPADSRIMDVGNVYHLWILAPKEGETEPPQFPFGAKNPELGGAITLKATMVCTERMKQAFDELPLEGRKAIVEATKTKADLFIFPDALLPDVEKEFPGEERVLAIHKYIQQHPELDLQKWEPALDH